MIDDHNAYAELAWSLRCTDSSLRCTDSSENLKTGTSLLMLPWRYWISTVLNETELCQISKNKISNKESTIHLSVAKLEICSISFSSCRSGNFSSCRSVDQLISLTLSGEAASKLLINSRFGQTKRPSLEIKVERIEKIKVTDASEIDM